MQDYRKLRVWHAAHELAVAAYEVTRAFPRSELFALVKQIREAACSVPGNIAEGCGRHGNRELAYFLYVANGSLNEVEYYLFFSQTQNFISTGAHESPATRVNDVRGMLIALIKKLGGGRP